MPWHILLLHYYCRYYWLTACTMAAIAVCNQLLLLQILPVHMAATSACNQLLPLQTTSSQKLCNGCWNHPMNSYYCYGCHQCKQQYQSTADNPLTDISKRSSDRYFVAFGGHHDFPEPPVLISSAGRISPEWEVFFSCHFHNQSKLGKP